MCAQAPINIIDSHVHFFDEQRSEGIVWPPVDSPMRAAGKATPARRQALATRESLAGVIAVETSRRPVDDDWLLALADSEAGVLGAVLNLQPDQVNFAARLAVACQSAAFLGVRLRPIGDYDLGCNTLLQNLRVLEGRNKTIEFGARDQRLKSAFARLAMKLPDTTLILDHAGHPDMDCHADNKWLTSMREIAACPNAVVKVTMIGDQFARWRPTLDVLVELFGPGRLLYGSNWPVADVADIAELEQYFASDANAFFCDNTRSAYRI